MVDAIETAITTVTGNVTSVGTAAMAVVVAFLIWRKVKQAGNKV